MKVNLLGDLRVWTLRTGWWHWGGTTKADITSKLSHTAELLLNFTLDPKMDFSDDGKPLATAVDELWAQFPHGRNTGPLGWWLRPTTPLLLVALYLAHKPLLKLLVGKGGVAQGLGLKASIALHNLLLASYSGVTFVFSARAVARHFAARGAMDTCAPRDATNGRTRVGPFLVSLL